MKQIIEIDRFTAKSDTGEEFTIIEYQEIIDVKSFDNPNGKVLGLKDHRTTTGFYVNYIDDKTYKIVDTNTIVRR